MPSKVRKLGIALSRPKHGFESRWGRQQTYDAPEQRLHRPFPRESVVTVRVRREREAADDEAPQHLLRLPDVSHQQPLPVLQIALQLLPDFGRVDGRLRRAQRFELRFEFRALPLVRLESATRRS